MNIRIVVDGRQKRGPAMNLQKELRHVFAHARNCRKGATRRTAAPLPSCPSDRDASRTRRGQSGGRSWWAYQSFMKKHEKEIDEEKLVRIPRTLDLTPYRD